MTYPGTMAGPQVIPGYDLRPLRFTQKERAEERECVCVCEREREKSFYTECKRRKATETIEGGGDNGYSSRPEL